VQKAGRWKEGRILGLIGSAPASIAIGAIVRFAVPTSVGGIALARVGVVLKVAGTDVVHQLARGRSGAAAR
jgi:hypothetical protein